MARRRAVPLSRRTVLGHAARATAAALWCGPWLAHAGPASAQVPCPPGVDPGELLDTLPLHGTRPGQTPFGRLVGGTGLDARQFTDLSALQPDRLITPASEVFVRTTEPPQLRDRRGPWVIRVTRRPPEAASQITDRAIASAARPMGVHLIECAGNTDPLNFGLMSAAAWDGVPLREILAQAGGRPRTAGDGLLVRGVDQTLAGWRSQPGASWVIPFSDSALDRAFLAVRMNGAPLSADHGAPVRLVVPGWYGCAWIKWVDALEVVGPDAPATSQMLEFAGRTHQDGRPALARDFEAPSIDLAATPIRVEKRRVAGRLRYRVVGIVWGGDTPVTELRIRFGAGDAFRSVALCPAPGDTRTWSLWEYWWDPERPDTYDIALAAATPGVRTRRLDLSWYLRRVRVDEVG